MGMRPERGDCQHCNKTALWLRHEEIGNIAPIDPVAQGGGFLTALYAGVTRRLDQRRCRGEQL